MPQFPNPDTQFKPGKSGNINGRPPGARNRSTIVREAIEAILKGTDQQVVDAMTSAMIEKSMAGDVPAFKELMDSAYGKLTDKTQLSGDAENPASFAFTVTHVAADKEIE